MLVGRWEYKKLKCGIFWKDGWRDLLWREVGTIRKLSFSPDDPEEKMPLNEGNRREGLSAYPIPPRAIILCDSTLTPCPSPKGKGELWEKAFPYSRGTVTFRGRGAAMAPSASFLFAGERTWYRSASAAVVSSKKNVCTIVPVL